MPAPHPATEQSGGHPSRVLATVFAWVVSLTTAAAGCGDVHFIPAPFTPQNVELVYSEQEHLTIVRWRVDAAPSSEVRFEMLGPDGYQPIDFSRSVFAGGVNACGDDQGSCAQYVVRGHYPQQATVSQFRPIRAVHELYGELPGATAKPKTIDETFSMKSFFNFKNDPVFVNLTDAVADYGPYKFPRPFERAMWTTAGLCLADTLPDGVVFAPLDLPKGIPPDRPLSAAGLYCVAIRPMPADGGATAMVQARIATLPEVVTAKQVLTPPVEVSPIIYQVILDLEIPVADRCASAMAEIERLTGKYMRGGGAAIRKLPTINLSPGCKQVTQRTVAAADIADTVKQTIATFTEIHHQYHFMYFNNLDGPLPAQLTQSLKDLFVALDGPPPGYELRTIPWLFSPPTTMISDLPWMPTAWKAFDDPTFEVQLADYTESTLPFRTQLHRADIPVPLLSPEDVESYAGRPIKICTSSPLITPVSTAGPYPFPIFDATWPIKTDDPPAYLVGLLEQVVVPDNSFVTSTARVTYQICTSYCTDHGYVDDSGHGHESWAEDPTCTSKEY
jgi:hypothetical protein